jgi:hypothetical protein
VRGVAAAGCPGEKIQRLLIASGHLTTSLSLPAAAWQPMLKGDAAIGCGRITAMGLLRSRSRGAAATASGAEGGGPCRIASCVMITCRAACLAGRQSQTARARSTVRRRVLCVKHRCRCPRRRRSCNRQWRDARFRGIKRTCSVSDMSESLSSASGPRDHPAAFGGGDPSRVFRVCLTAARQRVGGREQPVQA